jgi:hypothetical protein
MVLSVKADRHGAFHWSIMDSRQGRRPVARGVQRYTDVHECQAAAMQLLSAAAAQMMALQDRDGGWRWVVHGADGRRLAESAVRFDNAAACGFALHELRKQFARAAQAASPAGKTLQAL